MADQQLRGMKKKKKKHKKKSTKILKHTGNLFRKNLKLKGASEFYTSRHLDNRSKASIL